VDAKYKNWYHVTVSIDWSKISELGLAQIIKYITIGTWQLQTDKTIIFSTPKMVEGDLRWYINYPNISLKADNKDYFELNSDGFARELVVSSPEKWKVEQDISQLDSPVYPKPLARGIAAGSWASMGHYILAKLPQNIV
jgi:hypothetical protein